MLNIQDSIAKPFFLFSIRFCDSFLSIPEKVLWA